MSKETEGQSVPEIEEEGYELIVDEGEESENADPTLELEARNTELQAQIDALKSQNTAPTADVGFAALADELKKIGGKPTEATAPLEKGPDFNEIIKESRDSFYKDPMSAVLNVLQPALVEVKADSDAKISKQALQISKLTLLNTPGDRELYAKYKDEIEEKVSLLPPSEETYQKILREVKTDHLDDLIAEKAAELNAQVIEKAEAAVSQQAGVPTDLSSLPKKPAKMQVRIPAAKVKQMEQWALVKGYDWNSIEDRDWVIKYWKEQGAI